MIRPMKSPSHPFQAWIDAMRRSLNLIENYRNIDIDNLRLEFACASRQLQLGWPLIAHLKAAQQPSIADQELQKLIANKAWYEEDNRFDRFVAHSLTRIRLAASRDNEQVTSLPPKTSSPNLKELLNLLIKIGHLNRRAHLLKNPPGWERFEIAPMLFTKSVCILTGSPHTYLAYDGLSFLLTQLEKALKLYP